MSKKLFGLSLFGFRKKDVMAYLNSLSSDMETKIKEKISEIDNLNKQISEMSIIVKEYNDTKDALDQDRLNIARAIINAQENANQILEDAKRGVEASRLEILNQTAEEQENLRILRQEIAKIRQNAQEAINRMSDDLEKHVEEHIEE